MHDLLSPPSRSGYSPESVTRINTNSAQKSVCKSRGLLVGCPRSNRSLQLIKRHTSLPGDGFPAVGPEAYRWGGRSNGLCGNCFPLPQNCTGTPS